MLGLFRYAPDFRIQSKKRVESYVFLSNVEEPGLFTYDFNDPAAAPPHDKKLIEDLERLTNISLLDVGVIPENTGKYIIADNRGKFPRNTNIYELTRWGKDFIDDFPELENKKLEKIFKNIHDKYKYKPLTDVMEEAQKRMKSS